jgi:hypothetical protein
MRITALADTGDRGSPIPRAIGHELSKKFLTLTVEGAGAIRICCVEKIDASRNTKIEDFLSTSSQQHHCCCATRRWPRQDGPRQYPDINGNIDMDKARGDSTTSLEARGIKTGPRHEENQQQKEYTHGQHVRNLSSKEYRGTAKARGASTARGIPRACSSSFMSSL